MKLNYKKLVLALVMLSVNASLFAQANPNLDPETSGDDAAPTPINSWIIYMAIFAVAFAFVQVKKARKVA
jgi:hypothetical protein